MTPQPPHPLAPLDRQEFLAARDAVRSRHRADDALFFRSIYLDEPPKAALVPFLQAEHAGRLDAATVRPPRRAAVHYDVVGPDRRAYTHAIVDVGVGEVVVTHEAEHDAYPYFTFDEFSACEDICLASPLFRDAMAEFALPPGFRVTVDPWPYGGADEPSPRYMQALVFGHDGTKDHADANQYAYPIPIIPVIDCLKRQVVRVDRLATGGVGDGLVPAPAGPDPRPLFADARAAEYVPELLERPPRADLRPLNIEQPHGPSFIVAADGLVTWQKWRFRLALTPREGAVLHDVCYEHRPVAYRLSFSELTVPYGDPRPPFHRKQAFDFGDGGAGRSANSLRLGCDCLGAIHYVDGLLVAADGSPVALPAAVCLHEQDNGVLWKHTNFRTGRAVVARSRELVVQFICTLANYEYIFAFKLDLAGGLTLETRATGIVSVVAIDEGKTSHYGNLVGPGVLAQNHQHLFAARIDPAIDSYGAADTRVVIEESQPAERDATTNPYGNLYHVVRRPVDRASWIDAEPRLNRVLRLESVHKTNAVSGKPVGYKLVAPATQLMLASEDSVLAKRAPFARHHTWVTGYRDGELWAAGEFTNQSRGEREGIGAMVRRGDWFVGDDGGDNEHKAAHRKRDHEHDDTTGRRSSPVIWSVYGLTHNPRVEDWPVMPVEVHQIHLRPADFFTENPALDVPTAKNEASVLVPCCGAAGDVERGTEEPAVTAPIRPGDHLQGAGQAIDAREAEAHVTDREEGRLSKAFAGLFRSKAQDDEQ